VSEQDVELIKSIHPPTGTDLVPLFEEAAANPGRLEGFAALLTPDFEAVSRDIAEGLAPGGKGLDGFISAWQEWLAPWERYLVEVDDFIDLGDGRVVVMNRNRGRMRDSEAEVEVVSAAVWTVREGKIARIEFFTDRRVALSALGLEEKA
jgi:ketosteroid isomerase-like protein